YMRTVLTINLNPGYTETNASPGDDTAHKHQPRKHTKRWHASSRSRAQRDLDAAKEESSGGSPTSNESGSELRPGGSTEPPPVPVGPTRPSKTSAKVARASLQEFINKDVYICEADGLPR